MNKESIKKIICYKMGLIALLMLLDFTSNAQNNKQDSIHGTIIIDKVPAPSPPDSIRVFDFVQVRPKFPGNEYKYIQDSIKYPQEAKKQNIQGTVYISCVIEKDGSISTITVLSSANVILNKEAIRVVSNMPKWMPGQQNGKVVRTHILIPVKFRL